MLADEPEDGAARGPARVILSRATEIARELATALSERAPAGSEVLIAGSVRRQADSVKDLDLVATTTDPEQLAASLATLEQVESVSSAGEAGARGLTHAGIPVELRIAAPAQRGNLLQHLTGSGAHNAALREVAVRAGLHISEYGVLDDATGLTTHLRRRAGGLRGSPGSPTSSPSCARTAGSCRRPATGRCRS